MREEETFVVLEGEYEFFDGQGWVPFGPSKIRCSLRGQYHGFRYVGSTSGRMMFITNGGGLDEYFASISPLELPRDLERFTEISTHYGYLFLPPP